MLYTDDGSDEGTSAMGDNSKGDVNAKEDMLISWIV